MTTRNDAPPVIFTDDGWILSATEPPVTVDDLRTKVVGSYAGTGGSLWWSIGDHEVYNYETEVGEIFGEDIESLDDSSPSYVHSVTPGVIDRISKNVRALIDECGGPMTALVDLCREAGLQFFPRVRMNSHYVIDPQNPAYGRFRRERPDLLIGRPDEELPEGSVQWWLRTGKDYAFPEVREYMSRIIVETFERFDVDGVELDFMRHPGYFRVDEAYQNRHLMTDLISHVRTRIDEVGKERGKALKLAVRVPPTLADSARTGLDVARWIKDGLVDIVVVGGGFIPFETPVKEFAEAAVGTDCLVYGCIEATRNMDEETIRALAARWWSHGAAGIYLYNFYTMSAEWNSRTFEQVSDPRRLERLNKRYELDRAGPLLPRSGHGAGFRYASPSTQLPATLRPTTMGDGPVFTMEVTDDVEAATADGSLAGCSVTLRLDQLEPDDRLEVVINGVALPCKSGRDAVRRWTRLGVASQFWMQYPTYPEEQTEEGFGITFEVDSPPLRKGNNTIEVRLLSSKSGKTQPVLNNVEIDVVYK